MEETAVRKFTWTDFAKVVAGFLVVGVGFSQDKEQLVSAAIVTVVIWFFNVYMKKTGQKLGRGWLSGFVLVGAVLLTYFNHPADVVIPAFPVWSTDFVANITNIVNYLAAMVINTESTSVFAYATILYNAVLAKVNKALGLS